MAAEYAACTHCYNWITTEVYRDAAGQPLCAGCAREHGAYYQVIYRSADAGTDGLYCNDQLIAGWRTLARAGYDVARIVGSDQRALLRMRREVEQMLREEVLEASQ